MSDHLLKYKEDFDGERFRLNIDNYEAWGENPDVCCMWLGYCEKSGHGRFSLSRKGNADGKSIPVFAHRLSYYLFNDKTLPKNLVCHKPVICHDPSCVNPLHLYDGTYSDNNGKDRKLDGTSNLGRKQSKETKEKIYLKINRILYNNMEGNNRFGKHLLSISNNENLYLVDSKYLVKYVRNWKYNRPCDKLRVSKIEESIRNDKYINEPIYVAELVSNNKDIAYVCYDGNHRLTALKAVPSRNIIVNLITRTSHNYIKERFITLNSGCPVPELYTEYTDTDIKNTIEYVVYKLCYSFKKCQSASRCPRKPHFNKDNLTDNLYTYLKNNHIDKYTLYAKILKLNDKYAKILNDNKRLFPNITKKQIMKANKTKCYLFIFNKDFTGDL
jgi:hypothetical protein